jgi:hypothetical protein
MLNDQKYKQIVNEWFAKLEKGYAEPPYTKHELKILNQIINHNRLQIPKYINESVTKIQESQTELEIEESEILKFFIPLNEKITEDETLDTVTKTQLDSLKSKINNDELKQRYSKYLTVFYYFSPNALGEISEILLAKLLGGKHTGASQGLEDLNVDGASISLKTTASDKSINLGSQNNLSPRDSTLKKLTGIQSELNNMTVGQIISKYSKIDGYEDMIDDIEKRIDAIAIKLAGPNNNEYFVWVEKKSKGGVLTGLRIHTQKFNKTDVTNFLMNSNIGVTSKGWSLKRDGKVYVTADNTGKYLNINPVFVRSENDAVTVELVNLSNISNKTPKPSDTGDKLSDRLKVAASDTFFSMLDNIYDKFISSAQ